MIYKIKFNDYLHLHHFVTNYRNINKLNFKLSTYNLHNYMYKLG